MPFTLSHPAAVLPFARGPLVPSALVIGAMAPDLPYFAFLMEYRGVTHRQPWAFPAALGIGLAAYAVFHLCWKRPLIALSPSWLRRRLPAPGPAFTRWVLPSLLFGTATHLFWDAFTHSAHGFTGLLPWLVTHSYAGLPVHKWLQYGSGAGGALFICWWLARWARTTPPRADAPPGLSPTTRRRVLAWSAAATALGGLLGAVTLVDPAEQSPASTLYIAVVNGVLSTVATAALALTVYSLWWHRSAAPGSRP
ncbi:DUF4184 family protein [Actinomadura craniellae]|uniref:DUF4184 family protein n=1 Tax=Actinomadura craniellae TaxID=2231787 RepID=UPI001314ADFF|nr:DUF4184 family protein [Actinomadura craniellae]